MAPFHLVVILNHEGSWLRGGSTCLRAGDWRYAKEHGEQSGHEVLHMSSGGVNSTSYVTSESSVNGLVPQVRPHLAKAGSTWSRRGWQP